ncbi:PAS domain-containing sensor histidine kinase [Caenimonas aquaedulcis]|uniref:histidine kinase n=1 Tax=Caenimonas aquaedulcis TaxID=2793270 RepID=A0A931MJ77_9BURK|nr:PAS domain S-box protein [Caenimonas aquaedulcis]MBG9390619.1 PAS domain S-box protein [Caenimonas aquaedulcis]
MRRPGTIPWLIARPLDRVGAQQLVLLLSATVLPAVLWWVAGSAAAASGSALAGLLLFIRLQHTLAERHAAATAPIIAAVRDAVVSLSAELVIVAFNPAAEKMFGHPAEKILGKSVDMLIPARLRERYRRDMQAFIAHGHGGQPGDKPWTLCATRASGDEFPAEVSVLRPDAGRGGAYRIIIRDVTDRHEAHLHGNRLAAIVESSSDAIVGLDREGRVTHWNGGAERMTGYAAAEMLGRSFLALVPPGSEPDDLAARVLAGERILGYETRRVRKDGRVIDVSLSVSPIHDEHGRLVGASTVARDITAQRTAERSRADDVLKLRELTRRLMRIEEEQKRALGQELHDQAGANLAALALTLQLVRQQLPQDTPAEVASRLDFCDELLQRTTASVRDALGGLRPTALDELGLLAALRQHARAMSGSGLMAFSVDGEEPHPRLDSECEIALFRIAQEAFSNALKHSGGSRAHAHLSQADGEVRLRITDDGRGVSSAGPAPSGGRLGLTTMRERADAIGAHLDVSKGKEGGTVVTVHLVPAPREVAA